MNDIAPSSRHQNRLFFGFWTAVFLFLATSAAFAQGDRGTITGTVSDPAGAVVPSAAVQAKSVDTGEVFTTTTTATGSYTLVQLPVGSYELSVTVGGFKKFVQRGITVAVAQTLPINVTLEVGTASESVTVTADATLLKTESGELSHNVTVTSLDNLPILGIGATAAGSSGIRNPNSVTQLIPGTFYAANSNLVVNGAPTNTEAYHVEGMDASNQLIPFATQETQQGADSIQEVSIQTSNFSPEYGAVGGESFYNVTMRSGTNQYHGTGYDYFVNEVLNAGQPFTTNGNGSLLRPVARRNDYGFTLGGPVSIPKLYNGRNRTFFFWGWEQYRETQYINTTFVTVPTLGYRSGDFSGAELAAGGGKALTIGTDPLGRPIIANQIYDPTTSRTVVVNGATYTVTDPFSGNMIPSTRMDPVALKIQALMPLPNGPNATQFINNDLPTWANTRITTIPSLKIDQVVGSKGKLAFYWSTTGTANPTSPGPGQGDGLPSPISEGRGTYIDAYAIRLNYDHTLSPTLLLHLGGGFQQNFYRDDVMNTNFNAATELGLTGATINREFPNITGLTAGAAGGIKTLGPDIQNHQWLQKPTFNQSLTWVKNSHTYKIGAELRLDGFPIVPYTDTAGLFAFAAGQTGLPSTQGQTFQSGLTPGFPYASFLLGAVSSVTIAAPAEERYGQMQVALFVQDSWKVTRKLTVDYGLRWDYGTYGREQYGRNADFSSTTPNPSANGRLGASIFEGNLPGHCNCSFAQNYPYAVGPRLGLAYRFTPKTVIRAGWGIVYNVVTPVALPTISNSQTVTNPAFDGVAMYLRNGIPISPVWPTIAPGIFPLAGSLTPAPPVVDQNSGRPARQNQWSIGVQREISPNLVVEASYVGNRGVWWTAAALSNLNYTSPQTLAAVGLNWQIPANQALLSDTMSNPAVKAAGFGLPYASFPVTATLRQALLQYPQYNSTLSPAGAALGNTWYDSLQAKVTKRYSHGLSVTGAFTWSKTLALMSAYNDFLNRDLNKTFSPYDQPFVLVVSPSYRTPKLEANKYLSWFARDWTVGALLQYGSGLPIPNPGNTTSPNLNSILGRSTLANRVPGVPLFTTDLNCHCVDPNAQFVLNPAAWSNPLPGQWGAGAEYYGNYRYERRPQENMNLGREFRFKEKASLNIRMEFTNIFNRTYLGNPTATGFTTPQTRNAAGVPTGGFGYISSASTFLPPRQGVLVARFQF